MRKIGLVLAFGLMATPAPALLAQDGPPPAGRQEHGPRHGPVAALLEHRQELGLTAEQVTRLEAIHADVEARIRPLHEQLRQLHGGRAQGQAPSDADRERARPLMEQLRAHHERAMEQVHAVLTDAQEAKAKSLFPHHGPRGEGGRRGEGGPHHEGGHQGHPRSR